MTKHSKTFFLYNFTTFIHNIYFIDSIKLLLKARLNLKIKYLSCFILLLI